MGTHGVFEISLFPAARRHPRLICPRSPPLASKLPSSEALQLEKRLATFSLAVFAMVVEMERHVFWRMSFVNVKYPENTWLTCGARLYSQSL